MTCGHIILIICGICGGLFAIIVFFWLSNNLIKVTRYTLHFGGIRDDVKIIQVSDLHGKEFGRHNEKLITKIKCLSPDIIAVTGDLIHNYSPENKRVGLELISALSAIAPVLYVSGNHEMRNKGYSFYRKDLKEAGAEVLDNRTVTLCGVSVTGLNGAHNKNGTLSKITPEAENKLLLAHMPHHFDNYANCGYDVVLCGHAHGGQWRIPFTGIGIYAPGQGLFPKYTSGVHTRGGTKMVISRGLGNSEFPLRLFNRPELVQIILTPGETAK